ncbi:MAG: HK97 gp10 family phage protein [Selenomonadaceae bacterium]|nr:HK97 gp10 family phage protein [Selenomonadaceae bacterium]
MEEGAGLIVNDAKSRAPVKTGKLRDSIHYTVLEDGGAVEISADVRNSSGVPYAKIVEYSPKINHPFLKPAIDAQSSRVNQLIKQAIEDSAER